MTILPIPVNLVVEELDNQYIIEMSELNQPLGVEVEAPINTTVFPGYQDVLDRLDSIESKEPFWDIKYGDDNPPPYPVTSVEGRLGSVTLSDLYDTESLSFEEIASIFNE